eukprot:813026_1
MHSKLTTITALFLFSTIVSFGAAFRVSNREHTQEIWEKAKDHHDHTDLDLFDIWKNETKRSYDTIDEELKRYTIWLETLENVLRHNSDETQSFKLAMNAFSDLTEDEFTTQYLVKPDTEATTYHNKSRADGRRLLTIPSAVNWENDNYMSPVMNQGDCGSCWAYAAVSIVESNVDQLVLLLNLVGHFKAIPAVFWTLIVARHQLI